MFKLVVSSLHVRYTRCNSSIDDTAKSVYEHTEVFLEISRGNCITDQGI